jgi:hypothetical protein
MDDTMLSRSGKSDAGGKLIARIDIPISEELNEAVIAMATTMGIPKTEYVRLVIERAVFGELSIVQRMTRSLSLGQCEEYRSNVG